MTQDAHESWNALHYPGTRQLCSLCDEPTGHCEEDTLEHGEGPLCEPCYEKWKADHWEGDDE
jgi:formylmethanofuran dehydrogenase subunit E